MCLDKSLAQVMKAFHHLQVRPAAVKILHEHATVKHKLPAGLHAGLETVQYLHRPEPQRLQE